MCCKFSLALHFPKCGHYNILFFSVLFFFVTWGLLHFFFWRGFFTIYSFKIGFEMSLGINRLFGLIDNDTFYSEFFFGKSFFFLLCELLLRQHNDFDRRKKKKSKEMNFCWSNLSFFFHLSSTWKQLFTMLNWCSWKSVLPTVSIFWWYKQENSVIFRFFCNFCDFFCVSKKVQLATLKKRHHPTTIFSFVRKVMI